MPIVGGTPAKPGLTCASDTYTTWLPTGSDMVRWPFGTPPFVTLPGVIVNEVNTNFTSSAGGCTGTFRC